jgi:hypothetical protein
MQIRTFLTTLTLVIMTLAGFPAASLGQGQIDPSDPLLRIADALLNTSFDKGYDGVKHLVLQGDKPEDKTRLDAIQKFANDCQASADQQKERPQTVSIFRGFLARRPTDKDGKFLDEVLLRIDVPPLLGLQTKDGKVATVIIWTLKFTKEGEAYLLESIAREYTNDSGLLAGVSLLNQV